MEYVIKNNTYGGSYVKGNCFGYFAVNYVNEIAGAKRWKTKKGVESALEDVIKRTFENNNRLSKFNSSVVVKPIEELQKDFSIEEAKELPPSKFPKQKLNKKDREEKIKDIAKFLIAHGWKPNKKYWRSDKIDSLGFTEYGNG